MALATILLLWFTASALSNAATVLPGATSEPRAIAYEAPKLLTGTIYEQAREPKRILFKFRRTASGDGRAIRVLREYYLPGCSAAARERVMYQNGRLASYELEDLQTGAKGSAMLQPDPQNSRRQ